jgi:hypothetical protein
MKCCTMVCVWLAALAALAAPAAADPPPVRFAIVIGNNQPDNPRAGTLHFADDDALATHRLLGEAGVRSVLLTRLDDMTARLHPEVRPDGPPAWTALDAQVDRIAGEIRREHAAGRAVELLVFYSGHGDVAHGEGYVALEDRHLTRTALAALLARAPATRSHVIIDACKSYFMAFERGPGGRRARFAGGFFAPAPSASASTNVGFVLSTSSDRDSHEWERFGGGVFSHQVRSALRGAADLDGDGRISYAELGAFLTVANQAIVNPRLRPDFFVRPPDGTPAGLTDTLLDWQAGAVASLIVDRPVGHMYVETAGGERVLDAHAAPDAPIILRLPHEPPLFVRRDDGSGREYVIRTAAAVRVSEITAEASVFASRGAAQIAFEQLFAAPFGRDDLRSFVAHWTGEPATAEAAPGRDGDGDGDGDGAGSARATRQSIAGITALAAGGLSLGAAAVMLEQFATHRSAPQAERVDTNRTLRRFGIAAAVLGSVAVASGAVWLGLRINAPRSDGATLTVLPGAAGSPAGVTLAVEGLW